MHNIFRTTLLACVLSLSVTYAPEPMAANVTAATKPVAIAPNAPQRYTVQKGDTLWAIAGKFLQEPWLWPQVWEMNKDEIKNPHRIYPGDIIILDYVGGNPRLSLAPRADNVGGGKGYRGARELADGTLKLSPVAHETNVEEFVPSIPPATIMPFLSRPLLNSIDDTQNLPYVIAGFDDRQIMGQGDTIYVKGLKESGAALRKWQLYRPAEALKDPVTGQTLAYESFFLGAASPIKHSEKDDITTMRITMAKAEVRLGDRLQLEDERGILSYIPHRPDNEIDARVIKVYGEDILAKRNWVIAINRGAKDGLEMGHVLALHRVNSADRGLLPTGARGKVQLPDERYGLVFVFRTFDNVSYALVMEAEREVRDGDKLALP